MSAQDAQAGEGRGCKVLVMDDEQLVRRSLVTLLEDLGYCVRSAGDGAEAVDLYKDALHSEQPFDVVVFDLTVRGGMGGIDALNAIRKMDPDVKALVSSGYTDAAAIADYRRFGFSGVMPKPYTADALVAAMRQALADRAA